MARCLALAGFFLLAAGSTAFGQTWAEKMFEDRRHDFGDVARGADAEHRFELTNLYAEDVHISSVRSSCGCTSVRIDNDSLKTHEKGAIVAKINTDRFLGQKGASITVTFDKPFYAQVQLQTRVYIRSDVVFHPGSVEIGAVSEGTPVDRQVTVAYAGRSDWQIVEVVSGNPHVTASVSEISRGGGQVRYQLAVHLDEEAPAGYLHEQLVLKTNDYNRTQVPILVEGRVEPSIVVSPASLFMGSVSEGQTVTKNFVLRGTKPFRVISIKCDDERFQFALPNPEEQPKTIHVIPVTFVGGQAGGSCEKVIQVETDLGGPMPELPAYAVVQ